MRRTLRVRSMVSVVFVVGVSGFLFVTTAKLARGDDGRHPESLAQLVHAEDRRTDGLADEVDALTEEIESLRGESAPPGDPELTRNTGVMAGTVAVTGPGLSVSLNDAPADAVIPEGGDFKPDDTVVHQQDVQAVVNALWAGGAEAMTMQGQRVTPTSAFRCVGNTLLLHGMVFSPPYVIEAIGDPDRLSTALEASDAVSVYTDAAYALGLGWAVERSDALDFPSYDGDLELAYARPIAEEQR